MAEKMIRLIVNAGSGERELMLDFIARNASILKHEARGAGIPNQDVIDIIELPEEYAAQFKQQIEALGAAVRVQAL